MAYIVGLFLRNSSIYVEYIRDAPELVNKVLHHWNLNNTYQTLSVQAIEDSVERAIILNLLDVNCETSEIMSDFDLEI